MISLFVCALVQRKGPNGEVISNDLHDMRISFEKIITNDSDYKKLKEQVAEKLRIQVSQLTIMNLSVLFQF